MKRFQPILILILFLAPMASAWVVYKYFPELLDDMSRSNHGEFVYPVRQATVAGLVDLQGQPVQSDTFKSHWTMLYIGKPDCDEDCRNNLDKMRQVRLSQGSEMSRVKTLFVIAGTGDISHLSEYMTTQKSMIFTRLKEESNTDWLKLYTLSDGKNPLETRRVYLIDRLGQLMMYFELDADSKDMEKTTGMRKDLKKLLKDNKLG